MKPARRELKSLYPGNAELQLRRYRAAECAAAEHFGTLREDHRFFSAPGRVKLCGNQTAPQNGRVIAASVDADIIATAQTAEGFITIKSEQLPEIKIDINDTDKKEDEKNTPAALVRGIVKGFRKNGLNVGGFQAFISSAIKERFELSGRAAFEVLIGTIIAQLFNEGHVSPLKIAQIGNFAENEYYGLEIDMTDLVACATGGFVSIDFKDFDTPIIESLPCKFEEHGHALCIVDTGATTQDYSAEYEAIDRELKAVAGFFGCATLRSLASNDIMLNISDLRRELGDRAVLRAIHFFSENDRVERITHALNHDNFEDFLHSVKESGDSSFKYLQNIWSVNELRRQNISVALNIAESTLRRKGACRIHGGGFAGAIEAFVPLDSLDQFKMDMEKVFGIGSCKVLSIRPVGGCEVVL